MKVFIIETGGRGGLRMMGQIVLAREVQSALYVRSFLLLFINIHKLITDFCGNLSRYH